MLPMTPRIARRARLLLLAAACAASLTAQAQAAPSDPVRVFIQQEAERALGTKGTGPTRVDIEVGTPVTATPLAPCQQTEPFLPPGSRLWGRSFVGVRCVAGANWSVRIPVTVRVYGPALVAARPLQPQQALSADDVTLAEVEWTREPGGYATEATQLDGRMTVRALAVGQPIPLAALRAPQVIAQGELVKVIGQGRNFAISVQAVALHGAQDGQPVRVRTESGRTLVGTARNGRVVDVAL